MVQTKENFGLSLLLQEVTEAIATIQDGLESQVSHLIIKLIVMTGLRGSVSVMEMNRVSLVGRL